MCWKSLQLKQIADIQTGPFGSQLHVSDYKSEGIPVIMPSDLIGGLISDAKSACISTETASQLARHKLVPGDIVLARRGEIGRSGFVVNSDAGWLCGTGCLRVRPHSESVHPYFLYLVMSMRDSVAWLIKNAVGQTMLNLSSGVLGSLPLFVPQLSEQAAIMEILERAELAIRLSNDLIRKKKLAKQAVVNNIFNRRIADQWKEFKLGELFDERTEANQSDLRLLSVTGSAGVIDRDCLVKRDTSSADKSKYLKVCPGDIAYNTMRMWQGVFGLSTLEGIVSPAYTVCTPKPNLILPKFAEQFFKLPHTISLFRRFSQGLVDDTLNLKFHHFSEIKVTIPSIDEQGRIAEILGVMDEEIALLRKQEELMINQKAGLMQKLLAGEFRLKEYR